MTTDKNASINHSSSTTETKPLPTEISKKRIISLEEENGEMTATLFLMGREDPLAVSYINNLNHLLGFSWAPTGELTRDDRYKLSKAYNEIVC